MSIAFAKDAENGLGEQELARPISTHENFVTPQGMRSIADTISQLERDRVQADAEEDLFSLSRINRDLAYWQQRKASARLINSDASPTKVRFGVTVSLSDEEGLARTYTIVGEDEANPAIGLISWISPVAKSLLGREVGDQVDLQGGVVEIVRLSSQRTNH